MSQRNYYLVSCVDAKNLASSIVIQLKHANSNGPSVQGHGECLLVTLCLGIGSDYGYVTNIQKRLNA